MFKIIKKHKNANILFACSFLTVICFDVIFANSTELFDYGYELALVISSMSMSYMAGYIFYTASSMKFEADRIEQYKSISKFIVKDIEIHTNIFIKELCSSTTQEYTHLTKHNANELLANKKFSSIVNARCNIIWSNTGPIIQNTTIHNLIFDDFFVKINHIKNENGMFIYNIEPELKVSIFKYFNSKIFTALKNLNNPSMVSNTDIIQFKELFIELNENKDKVIFEYEKIYGDLNNEI